MFSKVSDNDFPVLEELVKKIAKEKQPFERLVMKKSDLKEMFQYNQFKIRILDEKVTNRPHYYFRYYVSTLEVRWSNRQLPTQSVGRTVVSQKRVAH
jgi:threonyl-tRNA synthetase